jgi:iron complex outermembrane receptor protein
MKNLVLLLSIVALAASTTFAQQPNDVTRMSLEELMNVEVTTAGKKAQQLSQVPAAVSVITSEDIRRSTATTLPELLQTVPGVFATQITASAASVSIRGNSERFSNKMLVLIDGRSVYTPFFSGVFWEIQNLMLEDIDRIEVIRGPGGSLWGANAVTGVINIITRSAKDTQGTLISGGYGTDESGVAARYGFKPTDDVSVRFFTHGDSHDDGFFEAGDAHDDWRRTRGGLRLDWDISDTDTLTIQAEAYEATIGANEFIPAPGAAGAGAKMVSDSMFRGGFVMARFERKFNNDSDAALQFYWDNSDVDMLVVGYQRDTYDLDFQHRFQLTDRQEVVWGLNYRGIKDCITPGAVVSSTDPGRYVSLMSGFVQDEIQLIEDELKLTIGTKIEHNTYTDTEVQPTARLLWNASDRHTFWTAYTRALRTPSRVENDMLLNLDGHPLAASGFARLAGDEGVDSEIVDAFEIGWRLQASDRLSVDLTVYYHDYGEMRTFEDFGTGDLTSGNTMEGETYGAELEAVWNANDDWRFYATYAYSDSHFRLMSGSADWGGSVNDEDQFPHHTASIRAAWQATDSVQVDAVMRYVDNFVGEDLDRFIDMDLRIGWQISDGLELALSGRNLFDTHRPGNSGEGIIQSDVTAVRRSVLLEFTWEF